MGGVVAEEGKGLLGGVRALVGERWREIGLLMALLGNLFAMVALLGYRADDPTWLHPNTGRVGNPGGPLGALLADVLFQVFGYGAWGAFGLMVVCVLALAGRPVFAPMRALNGSALFVAVLGLLHLALRPGTAYPPGGELGRATAEGLESGVGTVGSGLALFGVLTATITVIANLRWGLIARRAVDAVEARVPAVQEAVAGVAASAGDASRRGAVAGASALWGATRTGTSSLWGALRLGTSSFFGLGGRVVRSFQGASEPRSDEPVTGEFRRTTSGASEFEADPDLFVPSDTVATAHSVPVLAEVQWEPTLSGDSSEIRDMFTDLTPRNVQDRTTSTPFPTTGVGSQVQPEPLVDRTQPGQFDRTLASEPSDFEASDPGFPSEAPIRRRSADAGPQTFGVTLTPEQADAHDEDDELPAPVLPPRPPRPVGAPRKLDVEVAKALEERFEDDGGSVGTRKGWSDFKLPKLSLLDIVPEQKAHFDGEELRQLAKKVEETLESFKVTGEVVNIRVGPVVTIFEFAPESGIKVSRIAGLADDLAMSLCARSVRIVAPIPGKGVVGIEIPSPVRMNIYFRELLASDRFRDCGYELPVALGKDVEGKPVIADLVKMPHLLVAGTTGAGKSVGVNGMLVSLAYTCTPEDLRLLLIDPKQLEFKMYDGIPHLLHPVITDPKKAEAALNWAVREMEERYSTLARWNTRNIVGYNEKVAKEAQNWTPERARRFAPPGWEAGMPLPAPEKMPFIVIVIDELADLMMVAKKEIETSIARLAQKARACGIHLILATQRPSADVVTGLIKANMPTRIAFKLKSGLDSRVILDENGAERLLGRGDMLHSPNGGEMERVHGAFVSDEEVERVCDYLREQGSPHYIDAVTAESVGTEEMDPADRDPMFHEAVDVVLGIGKASTSMIQRHLKIGYNRAARIIDQMEAAGIVGPADGARPRDVLVSENVY